MAKHRRVLLFSVLALARLGFYMPGTACAEDGLPVVTIQSIEPVADEYQLKPGGFVFSRTGDVSKELWIVILLPGSGDPPTPGIATPGVDYHVLELGFGDSMQSSQDYTGEVITDVVGFIPFRAGSSTSTLRIIPHLDQENEGIESAVIQILPAPDSYLLGNPSSSEFRIMNRDYGSWAARRFATVSESVMRGMSASLPDSDPLADPDHDGVVNLLEYALAGDPLVNSRELLPRVNVIAGSTGLLPSIIFRKLVGLSDVRYALAGMTSGNQWIELPTKEVTEVDHQDGTATVKLYQDLASDPLPHSIVRLKVSY